MSRILDPQFTFADLELKRQGVQLDPTLRGIAEFLDQHSALAEKVRLDLVRGLKKPTTGRNGITPSQTLRALILMRVKNWDYRELRERINDGYTLRGFTDFDSHPVPKHDAFNRAFNRLTPQTLEAIAHARDAKVPILVAINKVDKPDAQPERIKQQLADRGLLETRFLGRL